MSCTFSIDQSYSDDGRSNYRASIIQPSEPTINSPVLNLSVTISRPAGPEREFGVTLFAGPSAEPGNYVFSVHQEFLLQMES